MLTNASSSDSLYSELPSYYGDDSLLGPLQRDLAAQNRRLAFLRNTVLFAALASEAFANEFLASVLAPADADALDRLEPSEKLLMATRIAGIETELDRGKEPLQGLVKLQRTRNALVHPRPDGVGAYIQDLTESDTERVGPRAATAAVVTVATVISSLEPHTPRPHLQGQARQIAEHHMVLEQYVEIVGDAIVAIPALNQDAPVHLMDQVRARAERRAASRKR